MLTRIHVNNQDNTFDALAFEAEREQIFNQTEKPFNEFEIDGVSDWCGCLYRVWHGLSVIGTFYLDNNKKWLATPFYKKYRCTKFEHTNTRTFRSNQSAINHIIRRYEG